MTTTPSPLLATLLIAQDEEWLSDMSMTNQLLQKKKKKEQMLNPTAICAQCLKHGFRGQQNGQHLEVCTFIAFKGKSVICHIWIEKWVVFLAVASWLLTFWLIFIIEKKKKILPVFSFTK